MVSLQSFMLRMQLLDLSSTCRTVTRRRRFSSSASTSTYNIVDLNNNYFLSPIVNPSLRRHKVPAFVYQTCPELLEGGEGSEASSQLAVHVFEGYDLKLRSEQPTAVSIEKFCSFRREPSCEETLVTSGVYVNPHLVPVSCVSTAYPCYDTESRSLTIIYRTTVEFRRRNLAVVYQTINEEQQEVDRDPPNYVSHAHWIVSEM